MCDQILDLIGCKRSASFWTNHEATEVKPKQSKVIFEDRLKTTLNGK